MKYNEYPIVDLGYSDIATLILVGMTKKGLKTIPLSFGSDGTYNAYLVNNKEGNVEIGEHYKEIFEFHCWLKVYDDDSLTFECIGDNIKVYRAGDFGCIISTN